MAEHKRQRRGGGGKERRSGSDRQGFTAFNMDDENDEGHFDADGNFIWDKEEKSVQEEAWLDTVSEDQIEAAKSAKDRKDYRDEQEDENMTEDEANRTLASLLQSRETVLQALQRLGKKRSKARGANNKRKQAGANGADDAQTAEEKEQFDRITEAADFLMRIGEVDVYGQMKEEFISEEELLAQRQERQREQQEQEERQQANAASRASYFNSTDNAAQQEAKTEQEPPADEVMWEYKGADGQIHGPFATSTFIAWRQQGYFVGEKAVEMRRVPKNGPVVDNDADKTEEVEKPAVSAEEELMNDFEDSEDDEPDNGGGESKDASENEWKRSDQIDFDALLQA